MIDKPCNCRVCRDARDPNWAMTEPVMVLCPTCGNKRCPHATDHRFACTGSNEPGQYGSDYGERPADLAKLSRLRAERDEAREATKLWIENSMATCKADMTALQEQIERAEAAVARADALAAKVEELTAALKTAHADFARNDRQDERQGDR